MLIKPSTHETAAAIDMTPIIDMVFLLLIFFLIATTFRQEEREMQVALPIAQSAGPLSSALRELILNVDQQGRIVVSGRTMTLDELRQLVGEAVRANAQQKVTVRGDRQVAYGVVVQVLDVCKGAGVQEPYLDTVLE